MALWVNTRGGGTEVEKRRGKGRLGWDGWAGGRVRWRGRKRGLGMEGVSCHGTQSSSLSSLPLLRSLLPPLRTSSSRSSASCGTSASPRSAPSLWPSPSSRAPPSSCSTSGRTRGRVKQRGRVLEWQLLYQWANKRYAALQPQGEIAFPISYPFQDRR